MTNLTEKWKAGELKEGWYYIKYEDNYIGIAFACEWIGRYEYPCVGFEFEDDIKEVIAPVPSYKEYLESESHCAIYSEENKQLRKLLKECLPIVSAEVMSWQIRGGEESHQRGKELLTKIEEVLR